MKTYHIVILTTILLFKYTIASSKAPMIAIYANASPDDSESYDSDKVNVNYVRWIESAGGESVVIHTWNSFSEIDEILSKANAVLLQGGGRNTNINLPWEKKVAYILSKVIEINKSGNNYLPLWGTCQGFEILHSIVGGDNSVLTFFNSWNMMANIQEIKKSRLFSEFSEKEIGMLNDESLTAQFHHLGVSPDAYNWRPELRAFFKITSLGVDRDRKIYISTVEARDPVLPIYAIQFHPEKTPFDRNATDEIPQSTDGLIVSQRFGQFLISEARKNTNFMSEDDKLKFDLINPNEARRLIYQAGYYIFNKPRTSFLE